MINENKKYGRRTQVTTITDQLAPYSLPVFNAYGQLASVSNMISEIIKKQQRQTEEKYQMLIEQATDAILIFSFDGTIHEFNKSCYTLMGYTKEEYAKLNLKDILKGDIIENYENYAAILIGESRTVYRHAICKDGALIELEITVKLLADGKLIAFARDITARRKAETDTQKALDRYDILAKATSDTIWDCDVINNKTTYNDVVFTMFGYKACEINTVTNWWESIIHPGDLKRILAVLDKVFENKTTHFQMEYRFRCADGSYKYILDRAFALFDAAGKPYRIIGAMQDITDRKKDEKKLLAMKKQLMARKIEEEKKRTRAVLNAQEKERKHIGEELHDNVNQLLASTKLYLSLACKDNESIKELLDFPMDLIDNTMKEIRMLTKRMVTPTQNVNLKELVYSLLACMYKNTGIKTHFDYCGLDDFYNDEIKLNIYRILQEQTNNITKHAKAKNVSISIAVAPSCVCVVIKDDGEGFDVNKKRDGIGLHNIMNRVQSFNGEMTITSEHEQGCVLQIKIPVTNNNK